MPAVGRAVPRTAAARVAAVLAVLPALVLALAACTAPATPAPTGGASAGPAVQRFEVPSGAGPHDVAPAADGGVWFTAQNAGYLGHLDPKTGKVTQVPLGDGSRPHGVITGPDGHAWVTDSGLNAIVRVDAETRRVRGYPLPEDRAGADLNTAAFDAGGVLWFTGQSGVYGRLVPDTGKMDVYDAPRGPGPYGITAAPNGDVYYASLAGSHVARIDRDTGRATVLEPPTPDQGARRVWADSDGRIWVSEWNGGRLGRFDPATGAWKEWRVPGDSPQPYAVYVDSADIVWISDFGSDRLISFDPATERFTPVNGEAAAVRQIHGRPGEVWGAASGQDALLLVRTATG
ncbi:Vgb family protein [Nonomuraea sp. SYSU D8015]|uniref:Vgb family protein n=1 Tax=Nonomuraea sp. SYSU D8015 TaxID=2593644 RepID=UPI0016605ECE|nr:lyase [Nonomuraea sp. SYSU D8015]